MKNLQNEQLASPVPRFECAPVLLIGFNRPERLAAQVERLRLICPRKLFVAVDGPRREKPGEDEIVARTRKAVDLIDWPCELHTRFLEENHGCRYAPAEAISWMFESVESGIILEDDCVPSEDFFRYASELLVRYCGDKRVGMISGDNFYGFQTDSDKSYHFSRHVHIWGWATWKRAWDLYDGTMRRYQMTVDRILNDPRPSKFMRYWRKYLTDVIDNPTTWDIQWSVALEANDLLSILPKRNLVRNVGHEPGALHTGGFVYDVQYYERTWEMDFPLRHPVAVEVDKVADQKHGNRFAGILPRALTIVGNALGGNSFFRLIRSSIAVLFTMIERLFPVLFRI